MCLFSLNLVYAIVQLACMLPMRTDTCDILKMEHSSSCVTFLSTEIHTTDWMKTGVQENYQAP